MSQISFFCESGNRPFPWERRLSVLADRILADHRCRGQVNLILCTDQTIRAINREFRKQDKVTDVISMEWNTPEMLGEIYIARDQVKRQALRYEVSYYRELRRMVIHGLLHLAGYDHLTPAERRAMRAREQFYADLSTRLSL